MTRSTDDLITTVLEEESAFARRTSLEILLKRGDASADLLRGLCEDPEPQVARLAADGLASRHEDQELPGLLEELDGPAREVVAARLLARAPELALDAVLAVLGPVPDDPRLARQLAHAVVASVDGGDPRARAALLELAVAGYVEPTRLDERARAELFERARDADSGHALGLARLALTRSGLERNRSLMSLVREGLEQEAGGTLRWHLVWAALLLPREDLPRPARRARAHALYYATDLRPVFVPPPERWDDDDKKLALRFALEREELHSDVLGYLRAVEWEPPEGGGLAAQQAFPFHVAAVLEHLGRPFALHPGAARYLRERPMSEVTLAVDHIGRAFGDPARFDPDVETYFAALRAKTRKRILGWSRKAK